MSLEEKFRENKFVILAEMAPPKGADVAPMVENAMRVKGRVDAYVVPEMDNAVMRMSALGAAMVLQNKGMDAVMQVCCRDRNRLALQADLLAANACGVRQIMIVKGEAPSYGDHHQARAVYDIELLELFQVVKTLQSGRDMAGVDLMGAPQFFIGATVNAGAKDEALALEIEEMKHKIDAGAQFFIIPPVFDLSGIEPFLTEARAMNTRIIPTVLLIKSLGMARYIQRHMENVYISDDLIRRIQKASDKVRACIDIAAETISLLKNEGFAGAMISTIGWENKLPDVLERVKN